MAQQNNNDLTHRKMTWNLIFRSFFLIYSSMCRILLKELYYLHLNSYP